MFFPHSFEVIYSQMDVDQAKLVRQIIAMLQV
jgi:hypothetical protein